MAPFSLQCSLVQPQEAGLAFQCSLHATCSCLLAVGCYLASGHLCCHLLLSMYQEHVKEAVLLQDRLGAASGRVQAACACSSQLLSLL